MIFLLDAIILNAIGAFAIMAKINAVVTDMAKILA